MIQSDKLVHDASIFAFGQAQGGHQNHLDAVVLVVHLACGKGIHSVIEVRLVFCRNPVFKIEEQVFFSFKNQRKRQKTIAFR